MVDKAISLAKDTEDAEGYKEEDIEKILLGANPKDFKPEKKSDGIDEDPLAGI